MVMARSTSTHPPFADRLSPRERANFDCEDVLIECWITQRERDAKWDPSRGRSYLAFAATIEGHRLYGIRDQARTVHPPRNSTCRLREYQQAKRDGSLSPQAAQTAERLRKSIEGAGSLHADHEAAG
jgi:hypothetical protein